MRQLRAFTLIELMIVVAIIGILAAIAIPNFVKFQCRSKQSEAKGNLKALYTAEEAYRAEGDTYVDIPVMADGTAPITATNAVGFQPIGAKRRYAYSAVGGGATFLGTADSSTGAFATELSNDSWTINEEASLVNTTNGCN